MSATTPAVGETSLPLPTLTATLPLHPELDEEKRVHGSDTPSSSKTESIGGDSKADSWFAESLLDDKVLAKFYEPPESYESKHRYDTSLRW
jgi:hypothetical protein